MMLPQTYRPSTLTMICHNDTEDGDRGTERAGHIYGSTMGEIRGLCAYRATACHFLTLPNGRTSLLSRRKWRALPEGVMTGLAQAAPVKVVSGGSNPR